MEYYPMIDVTAEKFSVKWHGQALSDIVRCIYNGHVAFCLHDSKQLRIYIDHLRDNYDNYQKITDPAEFDVVRAYDWLRLAQDCLHNTPGCFSAEQIEHYYDIWFHTGSQQYGANAHRWRKANILPLLDIADSLAMNQDANGINGIETVAESLLNCNIIDATSSLTAYDIQEYTRNLKLELTSKKNPIEAIRLARAWLSHYTGETSLAISNFDKN